MPRTELGAGQQDRWTAGQPTRRLAVLPSTVKPSGRLICALLLALVTASAARAQGGFLLQGIADGEGWFTNNSSNLLTRNGGRPAGLLRLDLWGAAEPVRGLVFYAEGYGESGPAGSERTTATSFWGNQLGVRFATDAGVRRGRRQNDARHRHVRAASLLDAQSAHRHARRIHAPVSGGGEGLRTREHLRLSRGDGFAADDTRRLRAGTQPETAPRIRRRNHADRRPETRRFVHRRLVPEQGRLPLAPGGNELVRFPSTSRGVRRLVRARLPRDARRGGERYVRPACSRFDHRLHLLWRSEVHVHAALFSRRPSGTKRLSVHSRRDHRRRNVRRPPHRLRRRRNRRRLSRVDERAAQGVGAGRSLVGENPEGDSEDRAATPSRSSSRKRSTSPI